jgi:methionyl-tRNA synthetase
VEGVVGGPVAESYYFIGKDNIPFHAVYWPRSCSGRRHPGDLNLPTNVPANQYVTFKGAKASKSQGRRRVGARRARALPAGRAALRDGDEPARVQRRRPDRDELVRRINDELVATWGNLVNRVLAMTGKKFDGVVPSRSTPTSVTSRSSPRSTTAAGRRAGPLLERVELRAALKEAMAGAQAANAYLNALEPWKTAKTDRERTATTLWTALQAIAGLNVAFAPYVPFGSAELDRWLGGDGDLRGRGWERPEVPAGRQLGTPTPLFRKVDSSSPSYCPGSSPSRWSSSSS